MHRRIDFNAAILIAATLSAAAPTLAWAPAQTDSAAGPDALSPDAQSTTPSCFFRRNWLGGWRATTDARTIYIRVSGSVFSGSIYRLELQASYSLLTDPFAILINKGSADTICTPLDFRLTVSNRAGLVQWPIVERMTRLTPAEAAALPKKLRP